MTGVDAALFIRPDGHLRALTWCENPLVQKHCLKRVHAGARETLEVALTRRLYFGCP